MCRDLFYFLIPSIDEESALNGAEQAAPSGASRCCSALVKRRGRREYLARHAFLADSVVIVLFCGFLWLFRSESRGVFLVVLVVWCCLARKICTMFLLLLSCPRLLTHRDDGWASRRLEDLLGSAISRNCLGTCVSRNLWLVQSITTNHVQAFS